MAAKAIVPAKLARNSWDPDRVGTAGTGLRSTGGTHCVSSTAGTPFTIECDDMSNLYVGMYIGSTKDLTVITFQSTAADFGAKGLGDFTYKTTVTKCSQDYLFGPFSSARFKDTSTGSTLRLKLATTTGGTAVTKCDIYAFQIVEAT